MKQKFGIFVGIVSVVFMVILSTPIYALSFDMKVETFQEISTCPTIMKDTPPLNYNNIPVFITNFYDYPDTYKLSLELPNGWTGFVDPDFFVNSGETAQIKPLWITVPNVPEGVYTVKIKAKSGQTGDEIERSFNVRVLTCHKVDIEIMNDYKEVCKEENKSVTYNIKIYNRGKDPETFDVDLTFNNQNYDWLTTNTPTITVAPNGIATVKATVNIPNSMQGISEFKVSVKSESSYAHDEKRFKINVKNCYGFGVELKPIETKTCFGESADYFLTIKNFGKEDEFRIFAPEWVDITKNITIGENAKKDIPFKVTPKMKGKTTFSITVSSSKAMNLEKTVSGAVTTNECTGVAVVSTTTEKSVCRGEKAEFEIMIKNTGTVSSKVDIVSDFGTLNREQIIMNPKETAIAKLSVDTKSFTGEKIITITASVDNQASDQATVKVASENCYSAEMKLEPKETAICPCETVKFKSYIKNTGKLKENYTFTTGGKSEYLSLAPGEMKEITNEVKVSCNATENQEITASLASKHIKISNSSTIKIKSKEQCYGSEISKGGTLKVEILKSEAVPVTLKNTGERTDTYNFSIKGPEWTFLQPTALTLKSGEEGSVYLYISPVFGTKPGEYKATIKVKSKYIESSTNFNIIVVPQGSKGGETVTGRISGNKSVILKPGKEVKLNISVGKANKNITTNQTEGGEKLLTLDENTKLIIVGVLTIIIVMVLIVRFVTLIK